MAALSAPVAGERFMHSMGIVTCDAAEGLADIHQPDTELVIWRRALPSSLLDWLGQLDLGTWPEIRLMAEPAAVASEIAPLMDAAGLAASDQREALISDVQALADSFSRTFQLDRVELRLECITDNACWKFHRDWLYARLVTTYLGPATEWVYPDHSEQALLQQKQYQGPLEQLQDNDVALFKGSSSGSETGIVHRSPPIAGTGTTRLLLCLSKP